MLKLVIANKLYSSWSMRPWLVMRAFGVDFEEVLIPLRQPDSRERLLAYSPSAKVPVLVTPNQAIWESLAIIEYLAESFPDRAIWPQERVARADARAISNEMHGGFQPLRQGCPMNLGARYRTPEISDGMRANIDRIEAIWSTTRARFGGGGPFLYGAFSAADAMYVPVAFRLDSYQIPVAADSRVYMDALFAHPDVIAWREAALEEPWSIADYANGHVLLQSYRRNAE